MAAYAVAITFAFENEEQQTVLLDNIDDVSVDSSSRITEHPIVSGDLVGDHMFREPCVMRISGSISMNGSKSTVISSGVTLGDIQKMFERIKGEGVLCDIIKVKVTDNNTPLFMRRQSMALNSISWTEKINSMSFVFSFRQVMTVDVKEYDVDVSDEFLPSVTEPATLSFTDTLLDWEAIDKILVETMHDLGLITTEFLDYIAANGTTGLLVGLGISIFATKAVVAVVGAIKGAIVSASVGSSIAGAAASAAVTVPYAVLAVATIAIIAGAVVGICKAIEKRKYRVEVFERYQSDEKNKQEVIRFSNFIGEVHQAFEQLNSSIQLYQISSNEPQECMISIGGQYYIFKFTKNNTSGKYSLKVYDIDEVELSKMDDISGALNSYYNCTEENTLFRAYETGEYVYLMNLSEDTTDLTTYCVMVSGVNPEEFNSMIQEIIKKVLFR